MQANSRFSLVGSPPKVLASLATPCRLQAVEFLPARSSSACSHSQSLDWPRHPSLSLFYRLHPDTPLGEWYLAVPLGSAACQARQAHQAWSRCLLSLVPGAQLSCAHIDWQSLPHVSLHQKLRPKRGNMGITPHPTLNPINLKKLTDP